MATTKKAPQLAGTETEKNLMTAYMNESAAYTRYNFYASKADKEKYYPIGVVFRTTADNEMHHSKVFFKLLEGGKCKFTLTGDAGIIGTTEENLKIAMSEEENEGFEAYMAFAKTARKEGFDEIAEHFEAIATIEKRHYDRFARYLKHVQDGTMWKREEPVTWQCLVCGYTMEGTEPPAKCPGCDHPMEHYIAVDPLDDVLACAD